MIPLNFFGSRAFSGIQQRAANNVTGAVAFHRRPVRRRKTCVSAPVTWRFPPYGILPRNFFPRSASSFRNSSNPPPHNHSGLFQNKNLLFVKINSPVVFRICFPNARLTATVFFCGQFRRRTDGTRKKPYVKKNGLKNIAPFWCICLLI